MATLQLKLYHDDSDEVTDVAVPARWVICGHCSGDGKSSEHLGAISGDEFHHQWSEEGRDNYLSGMYDRPCGICSGRGRCLEPLDDSQLTAQQREALKQTRDDEEDAAADRRTAWYESGCPQ